MRGTSSSLADKIVAITGGAGGIGLATASYLKSQGAVVAVGDVDESALARAESRVNLDALSMLDVTDLQSFTDYLDRVEDELGPIDILINNAGIIAVGYAIEEHDTVTKRILDVNLYGVILGTKLAAARMLPRATGHIINIASVAGVIPNTGVATYCATKHAVLGFTDAVRLENRRRGIHFSAVLPALVDTEMIAGVGTVRGFKTAEPDDVATAIAGLIRRPRPRIVVPHSASLAVLSQRYLPRATFERLGRMVGAEYIFTDGVDVEKRNSYAIRTGTS